jgi:Leucine-rich repeat (LRR) protein/predicted acylesterase/phospholipase RssA
MSVKTVVDHPLSDVEHDALLSLSGDGDAIATNVPKSDATLPDGAPAAAAVPAAAPPPVESKRSFWPSWSLFKKGEPTPKSTVPAVPAAAAAVSAGVVASKSSETEAELQFRNWVSEKRKLSIGEDVDDQRGDDEAQRELRADLQALEDSVEEELSVQAKQDQVARLLLRASSPQKLDRTVSATTGAAAVTAVAATPAVELTTTLDPLNWSAPISLEPALLTQLVIARDTGDPKSLLMMSLPSNLKELVNLASLTLTGHNLVKFDVAHLLLSTLRSLCLSNNRIRTFAGTAAAAVHLPLLEQLDLSHNELGSMPGVAGTKLPRLRVLDVSHNKVRSFAQEHVRAVPSLMTLRASHNAIAALPSEIGELTCLVDLHLAFNKLVALPDSISALQDLVQLDVHHNSLRALPSAISSLQALRHSTSDWSLAYNGFVESPVFELRSLEHLRVLDLQANAISAWPESFAALTAAEPTRLSTLALVSSFLSGRGASAAPAAIMPAPDAAATSSAAAAGETASGGVAADIMTASTPAAVAARVFAASSTLTPTGTPVKATAAFAATAAVAVIADPSDVVSPPRPFGAPRAKRASNQLVPPSLTDLTLRSNKLSSLNGNADDMLQYVNLTRLDLSSNAFKTLPAEIALLTALEHLDLSDCASLMALPADLSPLTRLSTLLLAHCAKLAELPASLASLPSLTAFSITYLSAAAPRPLGVVERADGDDGDADRSGGCVPSRHCVGAIVDPDAMRARFQYNQAMRLLGSAPHPLSGAMMLALAATDGKRFLHNDGVKHMRAFVERPSPACASEPAAFRAVGADFIGRTMSQLARDSAFHDRLTQDDALQLLLLLASYDHPGVAAECAVALTALCGAAHEPQLAAGAQAATAAPPVPPTSVAGGAVAATAAAATVATAAPVAASSSAAAMPASGAQKAATASGASEREAALAAQSQALSTWAPRIVAKLILHASNASVAHGAMMALYFLSQREKACKLVGTAEDAPALFQFLIDAGLATAHHTGSFLALQTLNNFAFANQRQLLNKRYRLFDRLRECLSQSEDGPRRALLDRAMRILGYDEVHGPHHSLPPGERRRIRVLTFDGGGTRGLVSLACLKQVELKLNGATPPSDPSYRRIHEFFDLICGTSTGGIIAFALGVMLWRIDDVIDLYMKLMRDVFSGTAIKLLQQGSIHDTERLEALLKELAGEGRELIDTLATPGTKRCFVPATRTSSYPSRMHIFRNYQHDVVHNRESHYDGSARFKVWQALRATSSAPLYLEPLRHDGETFADGGLIVNNPSAVAIHEANRIWGPGCIQVLLSIGTGNELADPAADASAEAVANANRFAALLEPKASSWLWSRVKDSALVQTMSTTMSTLYWNSSDAEPTHLTLREVCPEAGVAYTRLNPVHRIYAYPLDTTDVPTLNAMMAFAAHYVSNDAEAAQQTEEMCRILRQQ